MTQFLSVGTIYSSNENMKTLANKGPNGDPSAHYLTECKYPHWMWSIRVFCIGVIFPSLRFLEYLLIFYLHPKSFLIW